MTYELSVVAPCYNEEGNVRELSERLLRVFERKSIRGQVVLVNDASTDGTARAIDALSAEFPDVKAIHHAQNQGIEGGWRTGTAEADGAVVCFMDADLQNLPEDVARLYRELKLTGADMVQGYRSSVGRLKNSRYILSKTLNTMLNTAFGMNLRDNKSGFVIARKETMADVLRHRMKYKHFQTFITVSAVAKGYSVREIETLFQSRLVGESFIPSTPVSLVTNVLLDVGKAMVEFRLRRKPENILGEFLEHNPPPRRDPPLSPARQASFDAYCATMPLHKWMITSQAKTYYEELKQSQWLTPDKVKELQELKLRRLIEHSYRHVAFYRERMDATGITPDDIQTLDDLSKLPMLTKKDVRDNLYFDLFSDNHNKRQILKVNTSGSTGEPFVCYADRHQLEIRWATTLRAMEWTGYRWGDPQVRLWHQTIGMSKSQQLRERFDALFSKRMFVPAYEMKRDQMAETIDRIRQHNPTLIDGYAESFNLLAEFAKQHRTDDLNVRGIVSSAQIMPDNVRSVIEESFGCQVFDKYGSREFSGIAYECDAHDGHHVMAESYIVEILKNGEPAAPGELGEVAITDLNNYCMPMIRYRIGDLAVAMDNSVPCACGRGLPRTGRIEGRVQAIIFAKNGTFLPGTFFAHLFKDYDHLIRQYQVEQVEVGSITLRIIKGPRFTDAGFEEVLAELRKFLGDDTAIQLEFVDDIPLVRTGKHQGSISKLAVDFQSIDPNKRAS